MQATNWNEIEAKDDNFKNPTAGGYVCKIVSVEDDEKKECLILSLDICEGEFAGRGADIEKRMGATWGYYRAWRSYKESARGYFRGFLNALEASNKRFTVAGFKNNPQQLVGLVIGTVLGEEEYVGQDKKTKANVKKNRLYVDKTMAADKIRTGDYKTPALKELSDGDKAKLDNYDGGNYTPFSDNGAIASDPNCPF